MDVIKLLEYLQDIIETSSKIPVTGKAIVDKNELLEVIEQIINYLPDEFKKAQWVYEEKERILGDALKEADTIKKENMDLLRRQIESHDITKEATIRAEEIISNAQRDAKAIRLGARDYADEILSQLDSEINNQFENMMSKIKSEMESFVLNMNSEINITTNTIRNNIKELRNMK